MKRKVYRLKKETRSRLLRVRCAIDRLLCFDDSVDGLRCSSDFVIVRPALHSLYTYLWARNDESLIKSVLEDVPVRKRVVEEVPEDPGFVDLPF